MNLPLSRTGGAWFVLRVALLVAAVVVFALGLLWLGVAIAALLLIDALLLLFELVA